MDTTEPLEIIAGDTVKWLITNTDYPATSWTMRYAFRGASVLNATATASGSSHLVVLTATQTTNLQAGSYEFAAQVTSGSEAYTVRNGRITVRPNLMTAGAGDRVSHAEKMLAAIEAVLEGRITADVMAYTIAGRSVTKIPVKELLELRAKYARDLYYAKNGKDTYGKSIQVHFTKPE